MLKIVNVPNQVLTTACQPIVSFDSHLTQLVKEMEKTLVAQTDPQGVGLAAPQIGKNIRLFIIKPKAKSKIEAFVNPRIIQSIHSTPGVQRKNTKLQKQNTDSTDSTDKLKNKQKAKTPLEGCLSIPKIWGPIKRANQVLLEYQTVTGQKKKEWFTGFKATIIQHECDHLNGILFTQRSLEQKAPLYEEKSSKLEKINYP